MNRIQGDSLGFFACGFPKLFCVTGGSRVYLFSSHLSQHCESSGSKLLWASIPLLKSSLQLLTGVFKEASFPLVISVQFTWCYFLVSTSYLKAHYYVSEGRTHLGNFNTYKLIWLHRLEEKIMLVLHVQIFYIACLSCRTNKYWWSSYTSKLVMIRLIPQASHWESEFYQWTVVSWNYCFVCVPLCFLVYFCSIRIYILYPSNFIWQKLPNSMFAPLSFSEFMFVSYLVFIVHHLVQFFNISFNSEYILFNVSLRGSRFYILSTHLNFKDSILCLVTSIFYFPLFSFLLLGFHS